jgi:MFS family permease
MKNDRTRIILLSVPIILGILVGYIYQFTPSALIFRIAESYSLFRPDGTLDLIKLNLSESIIFPFIIVSSLSGALIDQKINTRNMYTLTLAMLAVGILISGIAPSYAIFLIGRSIYGIGFGLSVSFIGSAIVQWYKPEHREIMFTINGLFPFVGTAIAFSLIIPLSIGLGNSWSHVLILLGSVCVIMLIYWKIGSSNLVVDYYKEEKTNEKLLKIYRFLISNANIRYLSIAFFADFFFYAFIIAVLIAFLKTTSSISETSAGIWAGIAFPAVSIFGGIISGTLMISTGMKKPAMLLAQMMKLLGVAGILAGALTSILPIIIIGIVFYGVGDGMFPPTMYSIIGELENMTPTRVGAGFSLVLSFGFTAGIISPIFGAWLNNQIIDSSKIVNPVAAQAYGLTWSLFFIGIVSCIVCLVFINKIKETGTMKFSKNSKETSDTSIMSTEQ